MRLRKGNNYKFSIDSFEMMLSYVWKFGYRNVDVESLFKIGDSLNGFGRRR